MRTTLVQKPQHATQGPPQIVDGADGVAVCADSREGSEPNVGGATERAKVERSTDRGETALPAGFTADPAVFMEWAGDVSVRLTWLRSFSRLLVDNVEEIRREICAETGKSAWEAFSGDVLPLLASCTWHRRHGAKLLVARSARGRPTWLLGQRHSVRRAPLGHVAIIATWNYPIQLLGIQLVQALFAGNRVSVKPSEHSPRSQALLLELAQRAGQSLLGVPAMEHLIERWPAEREAGERMLRARRYDHIVFTGSTAVGRRVAAIAAETLTPSTLELSGHDSVIVLEDADVGLAARCIWAGLTMNAGQTCMAPRRVIVDRRAYAGLVAALAPLAAGAKPLRLISASAAEATFQHVATTLKSGGRSLSGVMEAPVGPMLRAMVIADCDVDSPLTRGDHFGPVIALVPIDAKTPEDLVSAHLSSGGQYLATSIFTRKPGRVEAIADALGSSNIVINDVIIPTAHPGVSIQGRGLSGWGASRGPEGLLAMTRGVCVSETSRAVRLAPEAPEPKLAEMIQRVLLGWYGRWSGFAARQAPAEFERSTFQESRREFAVPPAHVGGGATPEAQST